MARARNLKPSFFTDDEVAELEPLTRLLFAGLWCIADREGRLQDKPKKIKAELMPYDDVNVDSMVQALCEHRFCIRYEVDGQRFIQVRRFLKHQNPHCKEPVSTIPAPAPDEHRASTVQAPEEPGSRPADSGFRIPDSLNRFPDSLDPPPDPGSPQPAIAAAAKLRTPEPADQQKSKPVEKKVEDKTEAHPTPAERIAELAKALTKPPTGERRLSRDEQLAAVAELQRLTAKGLPQ